MRKITFIPSIDPFIWVFLLLTGKLFGRVICFRYRFVPKWRIERLHTFDLAMQNFSELHLKAIDFTKRETMPDCDAKLFLKDTTVDLSLYQHSKMLAHISDVFISIDVINTLKLEGDAYIEIPVIFGKNLDNIEQWVTDNSALQPCRSFFLSKIYPALNRLLFIVFTSIAYIKIKLKSRLPLNQSFDYIFNQVKPSEGSTDHRHDLSCTILSEHTHKGRMKINYVIKSDDVRRLWQGDGFDAIKSITDLTASPTLFSILAVATKIMTRHVSLNTPSSFMSAIKIVYADALIRESSVKGYISTVSVAGNTPIETLAFKAHKKKTAILFYSNAMFHNVSMSYLLFDHVFVWTDLQKKFLSSFPQNEHICYHVVGPLMFGDDTLPQPSPKKHLNNDIIIGVYDITPKPVQLIDDVRITTNYTVDYYKSFFSDILELKNLDSRISIKNKQKRKEASTTDFNFGPIKQENPNMNPFKSIDECDVVICMPYTSIYFAAVHRGIPAIFYSSLGNCYYNGFEELDSRLIVGKDALFAEITKIIGKYDSQFNNNSVNSKIQKGHHKLTPLELTRNTLHNFVDNS